MAMCVATVRSQLKVWVNGLTLEHSIALPPCVWNTATLCKLQWSIRLRLNNPQHFVKHDIQQILIL